MKVMVQKVTGEQLENILITLGIYLIYLIGVISIVYILRESINYVLKKRNFHFKTANTEVLISESNEQINIDNTLSEPVTDKQTEEANIASSELSTESDYWVALFSAFSTEHFDKAEQIYNEFRKSEQSGVRNVEIKIVYLYLKCRHLNSGSALKELIGLANNPQNAYEANKWLGTYYEHISDNKNAAGAYLDSKINAPDSNSMARSTLSYVDNIIKAGSIEDPLPIVKASLSDTTDEDAKSMLYEALAKIYTALGDHDISAIALEMAVQFRPNNTALRFNLAYAYSNNNFTSLSFKHYKTLSKISPTDEATLNNYGLVFQKLDMNNKAVLTLRKAASLGETLAMSNLANRYVSVGFFKEATELLNDALELDDVHRNVSNSLAKIGELEEAEKEKEEQVEKAANEQSQFLQSFANAYFKEMQENINFNGIWSTENFELNISQNWNTIEATGELEKNKYKFRGVISNAGGKITESKPSMLSSIFNKPGDNIKFEESGKGFIFLNENNTVLNLMSYDKNGYKIYKLIKSQKILTSPVE